jgi:diaminopimelate epimerase
MSESAVAFTKGHGTGNDFVLVPDPDDVLLVTAQAVRAICDRRTGVGADGLIRVVPDAQGGWFMDYHNADGSIGEMCGNGARVFAAYLSAHDLVDTERFSIGTRGGRREIALLGDQISVDMGVPRYEPAVVQVRANGRTWPAQAVFMPNPHAVVFVDDLAAPGPLLEAPEVASEVFPEGVNVEFVVLEQPGERASMRVHERGVGETQSCGTGICAVADRLLADAAIVGPAEVQIEVPGGTLSVRRTESGSLVLTGPAVLVAEGHLSPSLSELLRG